MTPNPTNQKPARTMTHAFVTGATGLLGNNLVRALLKENIQVTALVRSEEKARKQFADLTIQIVKGDILEPESYRDYLAGCDSLFHTAAFFRDNYKGGKHWQELYDTNIIGTNNLLEAAYEAGIRQFVHTSSCVVLEGEANQLIDESMSRSKDTPFDYYRSKILSEESVRDFLDKHSDVFGCFILPSVMLGPRDLGPTSSGQLIINFVEQKLPGILKASYNMVDARDVADIHLRAMKYGRSKERYLAVGRQVTMTELYQILEKITGVPAPKCKISPLFVKIYAQASELYHRLTKKPILVTNELAHLMAEEYLKSNFSFAKTESELGGQHRPLEESLADVVDWYRKHGYFAK